MSLGALHHVTLTVSDIEASIRFYRDVIGLRVTMDLPMGGSLATLFSLRQGTGERARAVMMTQGDSAIGQVELIEFWPPGATTAPKRPGDPGVFQLCFEVRGEELNDVHQRLLSRGIKFFTPAPVELELRGLGHIRALIVEDPDGVLVEIIRLPTPDEMKAYRIAARGASKGTP